MPKKNKRKFSKELERIRRRESYKYFQEMLEFLSRNPSQIEVLRKMHQVIDKYRGFRSQRNSIYALESLELLAKDKKLSGGEKAKR